MSCGRSTTKNESDGKSGTEEKIKKEDTKQETTKEQEKTDPVDTKKRTAASMEEIRDMTDVKAVEEIKLLTPDEKEALANWDGSKWTFDMALMKTIGMYESKTGKRYAYNPDKPIYIQCGEDGGSSAVTGNAWFSLYKVPASKYKEWELKKSENGDKYTFTYPAGMKYLEIAFVQFDTDENGTVIPETVRYAKISEAVVQYGPGGGIVWKPTWMHPKRHTLKDEGFVKEHGDGIWAAGNNTDI